jgi:glycosyltransferase involved in cell wall biosynthesis
VSRPYLTVLTTPMQPGPVRLYRGARRLARRVVKPGVPLPESSPYPGHYALVRSVVEGLRGIQADFNFNPASFGQLARVVYAPANEALRQAAALKQRRAIDYLVAGPVNALFADECDSILQTPGIDLVIIASEWVRGFYREVPALTAKSRVCPAGVDSDYWQPAGRPRDRTAVVYWKNGDETFCEAVEATVRQCGLEPIRIASRAGEHRLFEPAEYRDRLDRAAVGVFLSAFETQGIALAEAWSMDVPTVVWDPRGEAEWRGRRFTAGSSAPYLTPATGVTFREIGDLKPALDRALQSRGSFQPRDWVLAHMTDAICSRKLYELIRGEAGCRT